MCATPEKARSSIMALVYERPTKLPLRVKAGHHSPRHGTRQAVSLDRADRARTRDGPTLAGGAVGRGPWGLGQTVGRNRKAFGCGLHRDVRTDAALREPCDDPAQGLRNLRSHGIGCDLVSVAAAPHVKRVE